nr:hypothetical protein Ade03nite_84410 [Actinoplanes derwentensis]
MQETFGVAPDRDETAPIDLMRRLGVRRTGRRARPAVPLEGRTVAIRELVSAVATEAGWVSSWIFRTPVWW